MTNSIASKVTAITAALQANDDSLITAQAFFVNTLIENFKAAATIGAVAIAACVDKCKALQANHAATGDRNTASYYNTVIRYPELVAQLDAGESWKLYRLTKEVVKMADALKEAAAKEARRAADAATKDAAIAAKAVAKKQEVADKKKSAATLAEMQATTVIENENSTTSQIKAAQKKAVAADKAAQKAVDAEVAATKKAAADKKAAEKAQQTANAAALVIQKKADKIAAQNKKQIDAKKDKAAKSAPKVEPLIVEVRALSKQCCELQHQQQAAVNILQDAARANVSPSKAAWDKLNRLMATTELAMIRLDEALNK